MASNVKNIAKSRLMSALMDLDEAGDTMRVGLAMSSTSLDTDLDTDALGSYTIDDMDGLNNARKELDNQAVSTDDTNDRAEFDADDVSWAALGNGTRQVQGAYVYEFITNDAGSFPLCWVEFAATINPGGSTLSIAWSAEGIFQIT